MLHIEQENKFKSKMINCRCICGIGLSWTKDKTVMIEPCEHIFHEKCLKSNYCPICHDEIINYYSETELKRKKYSPIYYQKYVDMVSIKNINHLCKKNMNKFISNMPYITDIISRLPFSRGFNQGHKICQDAFKIANVKMTIIGKNNIIDQNKIIVANHSSIMDFMVIFYIFKCGFLASSSVKETWLGKMISKIIPILFIDRGKETNTVKKMSDYVNNNSLCVFPEGVIVHPDTLALFRTGAFYAEKPILPVTITYNPLVSDSSISEFIQKLMSQDLIEITVRILPTEYPPFNQKKINIVRKKMAKAGNFALSRISNRDANDKR